MISDPNDFRQLISDHTKLESLLAGCHYHGSFQSWEDERKFITQAINQDGSILDIGCANGFLLRCLQEWTRLKLVPYGIDSDEKLIDVARILFTKYRSNFVSIPLEAVSLLKKYGLPQKFNLIYWNVWDNWKFENIEEIMKMQTLLTMLKSGGRLILGLYDGLKQNNQNRIEKLKILNMVPSGVLENPVDGETEVVCWFDKLGKF